MTKFTYKRLQGFLAFLSLFVLASSFYFQYVKGLSRCALCLMQRFCVLLLFMICFIGVNTHRLKRGKIIAGLQILIAGSGLFFAGRQLWLQSLPAGQAPSCMPDLEIVIRYFPWRDVLRSLIWGTGDCAEVSWQWLGLSMPAWSALYFLFIVIVAIPLFWILRRQITHSLP